MVAGRCMRSCMDYHSTGSVGMADNNPWEAGSPVRPAERLQEEGQGRPVVAEAVAAVVVVVAAAAAVAAVAAGDLLAL